MNNIKEYSVLKYLVESDKRESVNAIIETKDGEQFACGISINGIRNWSDGSKQIRNDSPVNIERITFLINGKEYEFVACQD